jgi:hypothetical protein
MTDEKAIQEALEWTTGLYVSKAELLRALQTAAAMPFGTKLSDDIKAIAVAYREAREENESLQALFRLQHTRIIEAEKLWRAAHPGNDNVLPDLGDLLKWFIGGNAHHEALRKEDRAMFTKENNALREYIARLEHEIETWKNLANDDGEDI